MPVRVLLGCCCCALTFKVLKRCLGWLLVGCCGALNGCYLATEVLKVVSREISRIINIVC